MFGSWIKFQAGVSYGNALAFGNFDQCLGFNYDSVDRDERWWIQGQQLDLLSSIDERASTTWRLKSLNIWLESMWEDWCILNSDNNDDTLCSNWNLKIVLAFLLASALLFERGIWESRLGEFVCLPSTYSAGKLVTQSCRSADHKRLQSIRLLLDNRVTAARFPWHHLYVRWASNYKLIFVTFEIRNATRSRPVVVDIVHSLRDYNDTNHPLVLQRWQPCVIGWNELNNF